MTAKEFWECFESSEAFIREELHVAYSDASPAHDAFVLALWDYSEGLGFEHYKDKKMHKHVLTITAQSNKDYFLAALTLVEQAPMLLNWKIQALIPPIASYSKKFFNSEIDLDGIPIKIKHLKGTLSHIMGDGTYGLTFVLPFMFRNKDERKMRYELESLLEQALGERRYTEAIVYIGFEYEMDEDFEYTTIDKLDKAMLDYDLECLEWEERENKASDENRLGED